MKRSQFHWLCQIMCTARDHMHSYRNPTLAGLTCGWVSRYTPMRTAARNPDLIRFVLSLLFILTSLVAMQRKRLYSRPTPHHA